MNTLLINGKKSFFMAALAILTAIVAMLLILALPQVRGLVKLQNEIRSMRQNIVEQDRSIAEYRQAQEELSKVAEGRQNIRAAFPIREEMVNLVEGLEGAASLSNAQMTLTIADNQDITEPDQKNAPVKRLFSQLKNVEEVSYTMQISQVDYRGMINFVRNVEHLPYFTEFENLTIAADSRSVMQEARLINLGTATVKIDGIFFLKQKSN